MGLDPHPDPLPSRERGYVIRKGHNRFTHSRTPLSPTDTVPPLQGEGWGGDGVSLSGEGQGEG